MKGKTRRIFMAVVVMALATSLWFIAMAADMIVTDATDLQFFDDGAVYRIDETGTAAPIAAGAPLQSPAGVLFDKSDENGDEFFVTDIGTFYDSDDGAIFKVGDNRPVVEVLAGAPFTSPFGMLRKGCCTLYVSDFGSPIPGAYDGRVYEVNLDSDGDGEPGPYPLDPATAVKTVFAGPPLEGPNQMVWAIDTSTADEASDLPKPKKAKDTDAEGGLMMLADDSGTLYTLDPAALTVTPFGPFLGDPVGLGVLPDGSGYAVGNALDQQVFVVDAQGTTATLLLSGTPPFDQFMGIDVAADGTINVANAGFLFVTGFYDGSIVSVNDTGIGIPYSGYPLDNPFSVEIVETVDEDAD